MYKVKQALNTTSDLIYKAFAPRTSSIYHKFKIPYVSIILFILAIVCKSIQKTSNDQEYIQNIILGKDGNQKKHIDPVSAFFLNYLDSMGVNSFFDTDFGNSMTVGIIFLLINYPLLMMIEMNIGHACLAYFIIVLMLYHPFSIQYQNLVCYNRTWGYYGDSPYCCGSFFFYATIGCALAILLSYAYGWMMKSIILSIILLIWGGIVLYEYYIVYKDKENEEDNKRTCLSFYWHAMNFAFGVLSGLVMVK